jgi:hypothetical protein
MLMERRFCNQHRTRAQSRAAPTLSCVKMSRQLRHLDNRVLGRPPQGWYRPGHAALVPADELVPHQEGARRLGISSRRLGWRVLCGHLTPAEDENHVPGVTRTSLETELAWQSRASAWRRLRRGVGDLVGWVS